MLTVSEILSRLEAYRRDHGAAPSRAYVNTREAERYVGRAADAIIIDARTGSFGNVYGVDWFQDERVPDDDIRLA